MTNSHDAGSGYQKFVESAEAIMNYKGSGKCRHPA